jgi:uncharacterized membrane protein YoaK (UPF0700 family)
MRHYRRRSIALAAMLSMLAGYVDAIGFLGMGGFFVSFMSGNTTRFGVSVASGAYSYSLAAAGLISSFVLGVIAGAALGQLARNRARFVLLLVSALLLLAIVQPDGRMLTMLFLAAAMGAENAVFQRGSEVTIGLTYMTGTLVRFGQGLGSALFGEGSFLWVRPMLLWLGLGSGTVLGALVYGRIGLNGIWVAAAAAFALALAAPALVPAD